MNEFYHLFIYFLQENSCLLLVLCLYFKTLEVKLVNIKSSKTWTYFWIVTSYTFTIYI